MGRGEVASGPVRHGTRHRCYASDMKRETQLIGLASLAAVVAACSGCVASNQRLTVGNDLLLPAFKHEEIEPHANDAPSLLSVGRSEWEPMTIHVPVDGVGHRPTYRTHWLTDRTLARSRGEYPTATTAFEPGKSSSSDQIGEALLSPPNAIFDALSIPVLLFVEPQTAELTSPYRRYERTPRGSILPVPECSGCDDSACATCAAPASEAR